MPPLSVHLGADTRTALCAAIDAAETSIDAEFYSLSDPSTIRALDRAARRGVAVRITLEGDPHRFSKRGAREPSDAQLRGALDRSIDVVVSRAPNALVHGKAAVIDGRCALIATANPALSGFDAPGEALVVDTRWCDVSAVESLIDRAARHAPARSGLRAALRQLFQARCDLRIASEDLSDAQVVALLIERALHGHRDRVLVGGGRHSRFERKQLDRLVQAGVDVRQPPDGYMHEKFVDAGARLYLGSANLTFDGIDEAQEVGVVTAARDFDDGARALRDDFDHRWRQAVRFRHR